MTKKEEKKKINKKGYFKRRYRYTYDMHLKFLGLRNDSRKSKEFNDALKDLIFLIFNNLSRYINYEHVNLLIPRTDISTRYKEVHSDIVYIDRNKSIVHLMMIVRPYGQVKEEVEKVLWQKQ